MRKIKGRNNKLFVASDVKEEEWTLYEPSEIIRNFIKVGKFSQTLLRHRKSTGLDNYVILNAHGSFSESGWFFEDGRRNLSVQNFINKYDGTCLAILLYVCNCNNAEIYSRRSAVIHSSKNFSELDLIRRRAGLRIYVPGRGYNK